MSWSVSAIGKPAAVAAKLEKDFQQYKCAEPEETIKAKVSEVVAFALAAYPESSAVKVMASGSQGTVTDGKATNSLAVYIENIYGFSE